MSGRQWWKWPVDRWHARQRAIDTRILWAACRDQARDLDHARAAFTLYALGDPAWKCLDDAEITRCIGELT